MDFCELSGLLYGYGSIGSTESTASSTEETYATSAPAFASVVSVYAAGYVTAVYTDSTEST